MVQILRAFAWMRWRILMNSLEKTAGRDAVERFSLAIEHVAPILLLVVMVPSALALAALSGFAGFQLAGGADARVAVAILRYLLLAATLLTVIGPIMLPAGDRTNPVRLLLLPIPASTLYVAQASATLSDPWILLLLPVVLGLAVGFAGAGALLAAVLVLGAGLAIVAALIGLSALTTTAIHLVLRDRRRGELVTLLLILGLPLLSLVPASLDGDERRDRRRARAAQEERAVDTPRPPRPWHVAVARQAFRGLPSELYVASVQGSAGGDVRRAISRLAMLVTFAAGIHALGLVLFRRALSSAGTTTSRRTAPMRGVWSRTLPGVSQGTSAVALALFRLALRTPRGRSILLAPVVMFAMFGFLAMRSGSFDFGAFNAQRGLGLATFAAVVALFSIVPMALNQFAIDGAGLTLTLLSPLTTRQVLAGKAIGIGLVALPTAFLCVLLAAVIFGEGRLAHWLSLLIAIVGTYILVTPAAALFSALFPRAVDMNSIGKGSNAHGLAGLLGLLAVGVAALPSIALVLTATRLLHRPMLAPVLLLIWCAVAFGLARVTFGAVEQVFDARRENLAMLM